MSLPEQRVTTDLVEQRVMAKLVVAYFVMNFRMFKHHFPNIKDDDVPGNMKRYYLSAARDCISAQYRGDYEKQYRAYEILDNIMTDKHVHDVFETSDKFIVCQTRKDISNPRWVKYVLKPTGKYKGFDKLTKFDKYNKFKIEIPIDEHHTFPEFQGVIDASEGKTHEDALKLFLGIQDKYIKIDRDAADAEAARRMEASKLANAAFSASLLEGPSSAPLALTPLALAPLSLAPPAPLAPLALAPLALAPLAPSSSAPLALAPSARLNKKARGDKRKGTKRGKKSGRKDTKRKR